MYPTNEGKVLGSIIWNNMVDNFGTGKGDYLYTDEFLRCFNSSTNIKLRERVENMKSYISMRDGLVQYVTGYSSIETNTIGSATGRLSGKTTNIVEDDNIGLHGSLNLYDRFRDLTDAEIDNFFSMYALPNVFGMDTEDIDYVDSAERTFDIVLSWLSFPFINVNVAGTGKGVYISGRGHIRFGKNEEYPDKRDNTDRIVNKLSTAMKHINDKASESNTGTVDPDIYQEYWSVMGSAIVEYMNINTVSTHDTGVSYITHITDVGTPAIVIGSIPNTPTATYTDTGVYIGGSKGSCTFGSELVANMNIDIIGLSFNIPFNLNIPPICFETIIVDERSGIEKTTRFCLDIGTISTNIANLVDKVIEVMTNAITEALEKLTKILNGVLTPLKKINETIHEAFGVFLEGAITFIDAVFEKVREFLGVIVDIIITPVVEAIRVVVWAAVTAIPQAFVVFNNLKIVQKFKQLLESITIFADINELLTNINDMINEIQIEIMGGIDNITQYMDEHFNGLDFISDECTKVSDTFSTISSIPLPPPLPMIPIEVPTTPEVDTQCPTGKVDDDGNNICEPCNETNKGNKELYGECPVFDEDDELVEMPTTPQPFMPVTYDDIDYPSQDIIQNALDALGMPDTPTPEVVEEMIPLPTIGVYKTVILDNGHGGIINGVYQTAGKRSPLWRSGLQIFEGVSNREIVAGIILQLDIIGIPYIQVADSEEDIPLSVRVDKANIFDPLGTQSVYVSIHSNAASSVQANGYEAYSYNFDTSNSSPYFVDETYKAISKTIPNVRLRKGYNMNFSGKDANFYVLREANMPAILTESFFMSNEYECDNYLAEGSVGKRDIIQFHVDAIDVIARIR